VGKPLSVNVWKDESRLLDLITTRRENGLETVVEGLAGLSRDEGAKKDARPSEEGRGWPRHQTDRKGGPSQKREKCHFEKESQGKQRLRDYVSGVAEKEKGGHRKERGGRRGRRRKVSWLRIVSDLGEGSIRQRFTGILGENLKQREDKQKNGACRSQTKRRDGAKVLRGEKGDASIPRDRKGCHGEGLATDDDLLFRGKRGLPFY